MTEDTPEKSPSPSGEERSDGPRADEGERPDEPPRDRDEPLGDVAERIRERAAERGGPAEQPRREGPLADVAEAVDERRRREATDPFESVNVGDIDGEELWERLAAGEGDAGALPTEGADRAGPAADAEPSRDVRTVPKETCHGCPHLGEPPTLRCTHAGTAILAMPDADHFRVADCPMVVDDEEDVGDIVVDASE